MRFDSYGFGESRSRIDAGQRARLTSKGPGTRMADQPGSLEAELSLPQGVTEREAAFLLRIFGRLKERRFGRVEVTVREGTVTSVTYVEKVDRNLFRALQ